MHLPSDKRYTIAQEFCGYPEPRWVARFCGEFIGQSKFKGSAMMLAIGHKAKRNGALVIEAITADQNTT
ncbi:MAG: hypothetical protein EBS50_11515, partial [Sphingomonadaceae bacterium]|nr:hypothetical protein [Sphingomonadaceae bacterium]